MSKRVKNRKKICVVPNCTRRSTADNELSFHSFPRRGLSFVEITTKLGIKEQVDRHLEWLKRLRILHHRPDMFVCSQHFAPTDYFLPEIPVKTRVLKNTAVPSRNLPLSTAQRQISQSTERRNIERSNRYRRRQKEISEDTGTRQSPESNSASAAGTSGYYDDRSLYKEAGEIRRTGDGGSGPRATRRKKSSAPDCADRLLPIHRGCTLEEPEKSREDDPSELESERVSWKRTLGTQLTRDDIFFTSLLQSDRALSTMCGIRGHALLNEIVSLITSYYPEDDNSKQLSLKERIILTTTKLKTNASFAALGTLVRPIDDLTCRAIFADTLRKLATICGAVVQWVPTHEIRRNMPKSFRGFESTVVVLDCIELSLEKPTCPQCRSKTYSQRKSDFTAKFMTGVTPGGILVYVSEAFGGRASDTRVFEQSDVIDRVNRGEAIMVDRDFKIDQICRKHGIQVFQPLRRNDKKPLSEEETSFNGKLARARVHVDRMNQRIREFGILKHRISWKLLPYVQDIVIVCCAFANLGTSILGSDEFM